MLESILAGITAFFIVLFSIPSIIRIAQVKHLFDEPGERKSHIQSIPTLGGVAIFAGIAISVTFWGTRIESAELRFLICGLIIIFFLGLKDDIFPLVAWKKLIGQILVAFLLVHFAEIRIVSLFGIFGVERIPMIPSYLLTIFTIITIINSFNLIDGIDGLAGSIGLIVALTFGIWFLKMEQFQCSIMAFALVGALLGFLYYNRAPAKIFMGDTGSLIVGLICSVLALQFIEASRILPHDHPFKIRYAPIFAICVLFIPLFDTLRIFILRLSERKSPLSADQNHVHHVLLKMGLSHTKAVLFLAFLNISLIAGFYFLQSIQPELSIVMLLIFGIVLSSLLSRLRYRSTNSKNLTNTNLAI